MGAVEVRFALRPLDEVEPWGEPETGLSLHWFGLTEGTYELRIGPHRLYCPEGEPHGVDYYVARPWEDLMEVVRAVLDPVPEALVTRLTDYPGWCAWIERLQAREDVDDAMYVAATHWWWERQRGAGHLRGSTMLHMWCDGEHVHLRWNTPPPPPDGPTWMSTAGAATCTVEAFCSAVVTFDRELIASMEARVTDVERGWSRPGVALDAKSLRLDHDDRATWMQRTLATPCAREHAWDAVIAAVSELERSVPR